MELSLRDYFAAHATEGDIEAMMTEYRDEISRETARMYHGQRMARLSKAVDAEAARTTARAST